MAHSVTPLNRATTVPHTKTLTIQFSMNDDDQALYHALQTSAARADRRLLANQIQYLLRVAHRLRPLVPGRDMAELGLKWPQRNSTTVTRNLDDLEERLRALEAEIPKLLEEPSPPKKRTGRVLHFVPARKDGEP